jgi:hypothetical protein
VYVEQIASVQLGDAFRVASLVKGSKEAVGGVVVARINDVTSPGPHDHRQTRGAPRHRSAFTSV